MKSLRHSNQDDENSDQDIGFNENQQKSMQDFEEELKRKQMQEEEDSQDHCYIESPFEFYVDHYSDEKIKEIISIFRNDFKPPKNLWIEQISPSSNIDFYAKIFSAEDTYVNTTDDEQVDDMPIP